MNAVKSTATLALLFLLTLAAAAQTSSPNNPTWWNKYQYLSTHA
jgi:hypothetical protein